MPDNAELHERVVRVETRVDESEKRVDRLERQVGEDLTDIKASLLRLSDDVRAVREGQGPMAVIRMAIPFAGGGGIGVGLMKLLGLH